MTQAPAPRASSTQPLLDTDVLRSFVAIAEYGSFTHAAKAVFRTPSALSMQIKRLETTLDKSLFVREARRVQLTEHGELLLRYARQLLQLNAETVNAFLAPALEGTVRIGTPDDVGTRILPRVLAAFARSHPAVQVDVMTQGGPLHATISASMYTYNQFGFGNYGVAGAMAYLTFLVIGIVTLAQFRLMREK